MSVIDGVLAQWQWMVATDQACMQQGFKVLCTATERWQRRIWPSFWQRAVRILQFGCATGTLAFLEAHFCSTAAVLCSWQACAPSCPRLYVGQSTVLYMYAPGADI